MARCVKEVERSVREVVNRAESAYLQGGRGLEVEFTDFSVGGVAVEQERRFRSRITGLDLSFCARADDERD